MDNNEIQKGKTTAVISYILLIGIFIAISMNAESKNKFASFHIRQGLGLTLSFIGIGLVLSNFNSIQMLVSFWLFFAILFSFGVVTAIKGQIIPIPFIGNLFQNLFQKF